MSIISSKSKTYCIDTVDLHTGVYNGDGERYRCEAVALSSRRPPLRRISCSAFPHPPPKLLICNLIAHNPDSVISTTGFAPLRPLPPALLVSPAFDSARSFSTSRTTSALTPPALAPSPSTLCSAGPPFTRYAPRPTLSTPLASYPRRRPRLHHGRLPAHLRPQRPPPPRLPLPHRPRRHSLAPPPQGRWPLPPPSRIQRIGRATPRPPLPPPPPHHSPPRLQRGGRPPPQARLPPRPWLLPRGDP